MAKATELTPLEKATANAQLVPGAAQTKLQEFWRANAKQIASVTAGSDTERIMRVTYSLLYRNPKLVECTPFSLLNGIVLAHQMGLVFGTQEVSLVPFGGEATLIIGYQGKVKLALASKLIKSIHTDVVMTAEARDFVYEMTDAGLKFRHRPIWAGRERPSDTNIIGAYCHLSTASGGAQTRFVPLTEILDARSRSRGYQHQVRKGGRDNPWFTDFGAMAMKTAVHRAMKLAPQDARCSLATSIDDEDAGGGAVIAEALDPTTFSRADLQQPLVEIGPEAARQIAEAKLSAMPDPTRTYKSWAVMEECGETGKYKQVWVGGSEYYRDDADGGNYKLKVAE